VFAVTNDGQSESGARSPLIGSVRTAARALRALSAANGEMGVAELARTIDVSKSTAHRILATLAAERLLDHDHETGRYRLGLAMYEMGTEVIDHVDLHEAALPVLTTLRHRTGEMVHVAVLDGLEVVYVERLESRHMLPVFRGVGVRLPAHTTSSGKVLLASLSPDELRAALGDDPLPARTPRTITDPQALIAELEKTARRGFGVNIEEGATGVSSVGAPIHDRDGLVIAAVSVVGESTRLRGAGIAQCAQMVIEAGRVIGSRLGYRPTRS
jgi:DNA-binding IclR family transcriptional regulator